MRRLVSAYIVLLLLFLPLLADGSAGALANLRVQAAVLLFSCLGAAIALWRKEGKATINEFINRAIRHELEHEGAF